MSNQIKLVQFFQRFIGYFLVLAVMSGCAGINNEAVSQSDLKTVDSTLHPGSSTKEDVRKLFGNATEIVFDEAGYEVWIYKKENASAVLANHIFQYVPFVPILNGSAEVIPEHVTKEVVILFAQDGTLKKSRVFISDKVAGK